MENVLIKEEIQVEPNENSVSKTKKKYLTERHLFFFI